MQFKYEKYFDKNYIYINPLETHDEIDKSGDVDYYKILCEINEKTKIFLKKIYLIQIRKLVHHNVRKLKLQTGVNNE